MSIRFGSGRFGAAAKAAAFDLGAKGGLAEPVVDAEALDIEQVDLANIRAAVSRVAGAVAQPPRQLASLRRNVGALAKAVGVGDLLHADFLAHAGERLGQLLLRCCLIDSGDIHMVDGVRADLVAVCMQLPDLIPGHIRQPADVFLHVVLKFPIRADDAGGDEKCRRHAMLVQDRPGVGVIVQIAVVEGHGDDGPDDGVGADYLVALFRQANLPVELLQP